MTDKELKKQLKISYQISESDKQKRFVRCYERRFLQFGSILRIEMRYMGIRSIIAGIFLLLLMYAGWRTENPQISWVLSGIIPAIAVVPMTVMGRSERYNMAELESTSRFSWPFVRLVRLLILGIFSIAVLTGAGIWEAIVLRLEIRGMLLATVIPYLLSVYSGLFITRKWHSKESVYAVIAVGLVICLMPIILYQIQLMETVSAVAVKVITLLAFLAVVGECGVYMKSDEAVAYA